MSINFGNIQPNFGSSLIPFSGNVGGLNPNGSNIFQQPQSAFGGFNGFQQPQSAFGGFNGFQQPQSALNRIPMMESSLVSQFNSVMGASQAIARGTNSFGALPQNTGQFFQDMVNTINLGFNIGFGGGGQAPASNQTPINMGSPAPQNQNSGQSAASMSPFMQRALGQLNFSLNNIGQISNTSSILTDWQQEKEEAILQSKTELAGAQKTQEQELNNFKEAEANLTKAQNNLNQATLAESQKAEEEMASLETSQNIANKVAKASASLSSRLNNQTNAEQSVLIVNNALEKAKDEVSRLEAELFEAKAAMLSEKKLNSLSQEAQTTSNPTVDTGTEQLNTLLQNISNIERQLTEAKQELQAKRDTKTSADSNLQQANFEIAKAKNEIATKEAELTTAQVRAQGASQSTRRAQLSLTQKQTELERAQKLYDNAQATLDASRLLVSEAQKLVEQSNQDLAATLVKIETAQAQIDQKKAQRQETVASIMARMNLSF